MSSAVAHATVVATVVAHRRWLLAEENIGEHRLGLQRGPQNLQTLQMH